MLRHIWWSAVLVLILIIVRLVRLLRHVEGSAVVKIAARGVGGIRRVERIGGAVERVEVEGTEVGVERIEVSVDRIEVNGGLFEVDGCLGQLEGFHVGRPDIFSGLTSPEGSCSEGADVSKNYTGSRSARPTQPELL